MKAAVALLLSLLALSFSQSPAHADDSGDFPSFAIFPPIQYPQEEATIKGGRASVGWGKHKNVYGLDLGLVGNVTTGKFIGMAMSGIFNETRGNTYIVFMQYATMLNSNSGKARIFGSQLTLGLNKNKAASIYGAQVAGIANLGMNNNIYGFQIGFYNEAKNIYGFQIGLLNKTENLHGIQLGLMNIHLKGLIKYFPIINIGF